MDMGQYEGKTGCAVFGVAVFNPGKHNGIDYDEDFCKALVASYDPDGIYAAKVNLDHNDTGAAQFGFVKGLHWDGEWVRADLEAVPAWLASEITKYGEWPSRSVEIWREREGLGKPYFSGLAFLGCAEPAVLGMPPVGEDQIFHRHPEPPVVTSYFAAGDGKFRLVYEPSEGGDQLAAKEEPPMPDTEKMAQLQAELDALKERAAKTEAERDALAADEAERQKLAKANEELAAQNAALKFEAQKHAAEDYVAKLEADGKATPGMREAGMVEVILAADVSGNKVRCSADAEPVALSDLLRRVFEAMPVIKPGKTELAATTVADPIDISITPRAKKLMASAGLTEEDMKKHAPSGAAQKGGE